MEINEVDPDYENVTIKKIGVIDNFTGGVILKNGNSEFMMTGFSSEVAKYISDFLDGKLEDPPSIYRLVERLCEENGLILVKVKIYESGGVFRANLYFTGKKDLILQNFRASDAIALATFYRIPMLVRKSLLKKMSKDREPLQ